MGSDVFPRGSPLVSVVIPAYNAERTIGATLESVLSQTYSPTEIIVVDDGSTDDTVGVVETFGDTVRLLRRSNAGHAAARNAGVTVSRGEFVGFIDADDLWLPEKLERQVAFLQAHSEVGAVQCGARIVDDALRTLEVLRCGPGGDPLIDALQLKNLPAFASALVVRRTCFNRIGGFDASLLILDDWDLAIRIARHCHLASLEDPLTLYRRHPSSQSRAVDIHIEPGLRVLDRLFAEPGLPRKILERRKSAYSAFFRMLAGGNFRARRFGPFLRWGIRAVLTDPTQILYLAGLPLRRLRRRASTR